MAVADLTFSAPTSAHPMANPGFGKRLAPAQDPYQPHAFAALTPKARAVAEYVDQLPVGAAMGIKALASQLPIGQAAVSTALKEMSQAGLLRRVQELDLKVATQWVTRTYFSRTARPDTWWKAWLGGLDMDHWQEAPMPQQNPQPRTPSRQPQTSQVPGTFQAGSAMAAEAPQNAPEASRAHILLVTLRISDRRLTLTAKDCERLKPLVDEWFARGSDEDEIRTALTDSLPSKVHAPGRFVAQRLEEKMPPVPVAVPASPATAPVVRRMMICTICEAPGDPDALVGGLCADCDDEPRPSAPVRSAGLPPQDVRAHAEAVRRAAQS